MKFQFHITTEEMTSEKQDKFVQLCQQEEVRATLIQLASGNHIEQPMYTRIIDAPSFPEALAAAVEQSHRFEEAGFPIVRVKAECDPRENQALQRDDLYYEWHCLVEYTDEEALRKFCEAHNAHLSRNALTPGRKFVTVRIYDRDDFYKAVGMCLEGLKAGQFNIVKEKYEYAVYDSRLELDGGWA